MKNGTHLALFAALAIFAFGASRAAGCPHCNVFNLLAESVGKSTDIFVGEVLRQVDQNTAEVRVLRVLRGTYTVDSQVNSGLWHAERHIGKRFIFSHAKVSVDFEFLPLEFEDEVRFLLQQPPSVSSMEEAIKRVQGVSIVTQKVGMEYIAQHHDEALKPLLAELKSLMPRVYSGEERFFGEHRLGKLVQAILAKPTEAGKEFVFSQIDALPSERPPSTGWAILAVRAVAAILVSTLLAGFLWLATRLIRRWRFPYSFRSFLTFVGIASLVLGFAMWGAQPLPYASSSRGVFLRDMFSHAKQDPALYAAVKERTFGVLPQLSGPILAETVYALVLAEVATPEELRAQLTSRSSAEMLALGLYFAGNYDAAWWQHDEAFAFWDQAMSVAKGWKLRHDIAGRIAEEEQHWKRRK